MTTPNTALEKSAPKAIAEAKDIRSLLMRDDFKVKLAAALPKHLTPDRMIRVAATAVQRTPKLLECTPHSFLLAMMNLSAMGLEPDGRRAHLIPFGKECQLIVDYKGLVELAMRSGTIASIHADVVCENDIFTYNMGAVTEHRIDYRKPRGEPFAVYCVIKFRDPAAEPKFEVMSREEVESIRRRSRAANAGPWVTDWSEMAKKTVFRRASKWIQLSSEYRDALDADDELPPIAEVKVSKPLFSKPVNGILDAPSPDPELDQEPKESTLTAPEQKPDAAGQVKALRQLCKGSGVTEQQVIGFLTECGTLSEECLSFEAMALDNPTAVDLLASQWQDIVSRIKEAGNAN